MHAPLKRPPSSTSSPNRWQRWIDRVRASVIAIMHWLPVPERLFALGLLLIGEVIR